MPGETTMFQSMYVGTTGMKAHSERMQTIGNNIGNVNTHGYKSSRMLFGTLMSTDLPGRGNGQNSYVIQNQQGLGVGISSTMTNFKEGSFISGNANTDIAVGGRGYYSIVNPKTNLTYYTRAGNFRFDLDGNFVTPQGYRVQGYAWDDARQDISDTVSDIRLPMEQRTIHGETMNLVVNRPTPTTQVTMFTNIDSSELERSEDPDNPFFSMGLQWRGNEKNSDGSRKEPLDTDQYLYRSAIPVYDDQGNMHEVSVYFDKANVSNAKGGDIYYEFVVGCDPDQDGRANTRGTSGAGLLMMGTMTFTGDGRLKEVVSYSLDGNATDPLNLSNWNASPFSGDGFPTFDASFIASNGTTAGQQTIGMNFGITNKQANWDAPSGTNAAMVGHNPDRLPTIDNKIIAAFTATAFSGSMTTLSQSQNGYGEGFLQNIHLDIDGNIIGRFSNGNSQVLGQVALSTFTNDYGLRREGGTMFTATPEAGTVKTGHPNTGHFGVINQKTIEASNVDLATEFTSMILTQRGFQANSKVITTSDTIMGQLINIKK